LDLAGCTGWASGLVGGRVGLRWVAFDGLAVLGLGRWVDGLSWAVWVGWMGERQLRIRRERAVSADVCI
jgi:hypothetical protein